MEGKITQTQQYWSLLHLCVLSLFSIPLILYYAVWEPFPYFHASDAITLIGGGCALLSGWGVFVGYVTYNMITKTLSHWWIAGIVWAIIVMCYLYFCPVGYIQDIQQIMLK